MTKRLPRGPAEAGASQEPVLLHLLITAGEAAGLEWQDRALCAETDPEAFFPEKGGGTREAKRVCRSCEVRAECLDYALEHGIGFGIWGGASERERRRLKHARLTESASSPQPRRAVA